MITEYKQSPVTERLDRFEMFRQTLTEAERNDLDGQVEYVSSRLRRAGGHYFGQKMARELIMALVDFSAAQPSAQAPKTGGQR